MLINKSFVPDEDIAATPEDVDAGVLSRASALLRGKTIISPADREEFTMKILAIFRLSSRRTADKKATF